MNARAVFVCDVCMVIAATTPPQTTLYGIIMLCICTFREHVVFVVRALFRLLARVRLLNSMLHYAHNTRHNARRFCKYFRTHRATPVVCEWARRTTVAHTTHTRFRLTYISPVQRMRARPSSYLSTTVKCVCACVLTYRYNIHSMQHVLGVLASEEELLCIEDEQR